MIRTTLLTLTATLGLMMPGATDAQQAPTAPRPTPRAAAPIDLTGYWVSVVSEDWRWRMVVPPQGDYTSIPLNATGRAAADRWDPSMAATDGCKPYGAAAIMRVPTRLRIAWDGDEVLLIETDAGAQTRRLHFDASAPPDAEPTSQGHSVADWQIVGGGRGPGAPPRDGSLRVVTTNMLPGYYRRNGVPYSERARMTEYFDRHDAYGIEYFTVTTIVEDPTYLSQPFITSTHFRREADGAGWDARPCE